MKYIEKLRKEHPECVSDEYSGGYIGCPESYGYEPHTRDCPEETKSLDLEEGCRICWNREIPEDKTEMQDWKKAILRIFNRRE